MGLETVNPLHLTADELIEATGYRRPADQSRRLGELGIRHHRQAITGRVVVKRCDYEHPGTAPGSIGETFGVNVVAMEARRQQRRGNGQAAT